MLTNRKRIHFIGIGGSGMNPIASILIDMGYEVSGSDLKENVYTLRLKEKGAQIFYGHHISNIRLAELIVISSAIKDDNPELAAAKKNKMPIIKRAECLAFIMSKHKTGIAVAGTHGKTTVTSFIANFLECDKRKPTYVIGAPLKHLNTASQFGNDDYIVAEADESDRSFLFLVPNTIVITNIEEEHMDQFTDLEDMLDTYENFIDRLPERDGNLIINGDNKNIKKLTLKGKNLITYGFNDSNDIQAKNIIEKNQKLLFDVLVKGKVVAEQISLKIPGKHNIENCLVVFALALQQNFSHKAVINSFQNFLGASRRFHKIGEFNDIEIYDDYAHHPTEIQCTIEAARTYKKRLVVVFQPHRYSRFSIFYDKFAKILNQADFVVITQVYAAGEKPIEGVSAKNLLAAFPKGKAIYVHNVGDIGKKILKHIKPGDLILTLGAGDVTHVSKEIMQLLKA